MPLKSRIFPRFTRVQAAPRTKHALKGIDLSIRQGSIFGLLGPNGAGKSTTINILAGLVNKTGGNASIWGFDIDDNPRNARANIGIVPQELVFDAFFTPYEMLEIQAGMYGIAPKDRRSDELLAAGAPDTAAQCLCQDPFRWHETAPAGRQGAGAYPAGPDP